MKTYLVGGAVRDIMLGKEPKDRDYVVVGSTQDEMLVAGFSQVGAEFPVFLHPETGDEYALARKEKSTGKGYHDFETDFGADVTLEEDLLRRDLTINSMAMDEDGELVDPLFAYDDLVDKVLRATSDAFKEDPVRVLRLARFRAQLGSEWVIAESTVKMCREMVADGMLKNLTKERVSQELMKALDSHSPRLFFDTLDQLGALEVVFPVVHKMKSVEENLKWHPEGNTYEHTMLVLTAARKAGANRTQMFAALTHDFGKTLTDPALYPAHKMHEVRGVPLVREFADEMRVSTQMRKTAEVVCRYHMHLHKMDVMRAKTFVKMFDAMGAWNNPDLVGDLFVVGLADMRGKLGNEDAPASNRDKLLKTFLDAKSVKFLDVLGDRDPNKMSGEAKKQMMYQARTKAVAEGMKNEAEV